jgi:hypothetical protein
MSSWISRATSSHHAQLITTAVVSGVVVGGLILGVQEGRRRYRVEKLKDSIPEIGEEHHATRVSQSLPVPYAYMYKKKWSTISTSYSNNL